MFAYFKRNISFLAGNSVPGWLKKLERQQGEPSREQQDLEYQKLIFPTRVLEPWEELSGEVVESSLLEMLPTRPGSVILDSGLVLVWPGELHSCSQEVFRLNYGVIHLLKVFLGASTSPVT